MSLTTKILLNNTRQKNDGTYPLIIRLTYNRKVINIPLGYSLLEKDWDAKHQRIKASSKITTNVNRLNNYIRKREAIVFDAVTKLEEEGKINGLSLRNIKKRISGTNSIRGNSVFTFIENTITELQRARQIGNAQVYSGLLKKLRRYSPNEQLTFDQIDYEFLRKIDFYCLSQQIPLIC